MEVNNRLRDVDGKIRLLINVSSGLWEIGEIDLLEKILSLTFEKVPDLRELLLRAEHIGRALTRKLPDNEGRMEGFVRSRPLRV